LLNDYILLFPYYLKKSYASFYLTQIAQKSQILFAWLQTVLIPSFPTFNSQLFSPENSIYSSFYFLFSFLGTIIVSP